VIRIDSHSSQHATKKNIRNCTTTETCQKHCTIKL